MSIFKAKTLPISPSGSHLSDEPKWLSIETNHKFPHSRHRVFFEPLSRSHLLHFTVGCDDLACLAEEFISS